MDKKSEGDKGRKEKNGVKKEGWREKGQKKA